MDNKMPTEEEILLLKQIGELVDKYSLGSFGVAKFYTLKYLRENGVSTLSPSAEKEIVNMCKFGAHHLVTITKALCNECNMKPDDQAQVYKLILNTPNMCAYLLSNNYENILADFAKVEGTGSSKLTEFLSKIDPTFQMSEYLKDHSPWE